MIARSVFLGFLFFFLCLSKTHGSLGVISGQFCMINHAPEKDRKKKNPIYFLCIGNSCWKRSKGTDKEMRESTSSRLHLAPYERKKITLKPLPWWKKRALWLMYSSRGGINSINDSKAEGESNFFVEERECYLTVAKKTAIPLSGDVTGSTLIAVISGVCVCKKNKKTAHVIR